MFTKVAAVELGERHRIRVNCVAPGAVEVERTKLENPDYAGNVGPHHAARPPSDSHLDIWSGGALHGRSRIRARDRPDDLGGRWDVRRCAWAYSPST